MVNTEGEEQDFKPSGLNLISKETVTNIQKIFLLRSLEVVVLTLSKIGPQVDYGGTDGHRLVKR